MTLEELRQQVVEFMGFEPGDPAGYAYEKCETSQQDSMLPWAPTAPATTFCTQYYDENDQLLYKVIFSDLDWGLTGEKSPLFPHLLNVNKYTIYKGEYMYIVKRVFKNDPVATLHYVVHIYNRNDYVHGNIRDFDCPLES